ncbi:MAG: hypothetical protein JST66_09230, partial [Bacteroidetes bacterium]|nr:hypothetical protein [Bacteroidota bacterium]
MGLFVFLPWGMILLRRKLHPPALRQAVAAFGCTALIAGSWIVRMWACFPEEALYEWRFKSMHFSTAVAGHTGSWHFHFDVIADLVPPLAWWSVLPALAWLVIRIRSIEQRIILLVLVVGVHLFFLLAVNKMVSYTLVLLPFYTIAIGHALVSLTDLLPALRLRNTIGALALVALAVPALDIERTQLRHTVYAVPREEQLHRRQQLAVLAAEPELMKLLTGDRPPVLFHVPMVHDIAFMFRHGVPCMSIIPTEAAVERLRRKGYT